MADTRHLEANIERRSVLAGPAVPKFDGTVITARHQLLAKDIDAIHVRVVALVSPLLLEVTGVPACNCLVCAGS